MSEVAELAEKGKNFLLEKNYKEIANLMNRNFDLRKGGKSILFSVPRILYIIQTLPF